MLFRNPGFTVIAILLMGIGIGVNTSVFTVADPLILRSLSVVGPERLAIVRQTDPDSPDSLSDSVSYSLYQRLRDAGGAFEDSFIIGLSGRYSMRMLDAFGVEIDSLAVSVSGGYFSTLGIDASLGRVLNAEDDRVGAVPAAVISHEFWRSVFAQDPAVVGQEIVLNNPPIFEDASFTIVGVAPETFRGVNVDEDPDVWIPFQKTVEINTALRLGVSLAPDRLGVLMMTRLPTGMTLEEAQIELDVISTEAGASPGNASAVPFVQEGASGYSLLRARFVEPLAVLAVAAAVVLAIACANLGAVMLARWSRRRSELAVRLALGCGRLALARQVLAEITLVGVMGALLGLLLSSWGSQALLSYLPPDSGFAAKVGTDARVLGFTAGALLFSLLVFAGAPALGVARLDPAHVFREKANRVGETPSRVKLNKLIIAAQVGFATLLLVVAGLFFRTLENLRRVDTGFDRDVIQFQIDVPDRESFGGFGRATANELLRRLNAQPELESSAYYNWFGLLGGRDAESSVRSDATGAAMDSAHLSVGPGFFQTLGIPVIAGRGFLSIDEESEGETPVVVISESLAQGLFGSSGPIGREILVNSDPVRVIGVVGDATHVGLRQPAGSALYDFFAPFATVNTRFAVRTRSDPNLAIPFVRSVLSETDSRYRLENPQTMNEVVEQALVRERFLTQLTTGMGLFAVVLAACGVYGMVSYKVSHRQGEMGLRMALGARRKHVVSLILTETMTVAGIGIAAGLFLGIAAHRLLGSLLFGLGAVDARAIWVAPVVLLAAGTMATLLPARRAAKLEPSAALRQQ